MSLIETNAIVLQFSSIRISNICFNVEGNYSGRITQWEDCYYGIELMLG